LYDVQISARAGANLAGTKNEIAAALFSRNKATVWAVGWRKEYWNRPGKLCMPAEAPY
jgi:hypothetical protein